MLQLWQKGHFARDCTREKKPRPTPSIPIDSQGNKDSNTQNRKEKKKAEPKKYKDRGRTALAYLIHDIASDDEDETSLSDTTREWGEGQCEGG